MSNRGRKAALAGLLAAAACLSGVGWTSGRQRSFRRGELARDAQVVVHQFASRIQGLLTQHVIALVQMANFFETSTEVTDREFYDFASVTQKLGPACIRITALDSSLRIRIVYPPEGNESLVGLDIRTHPQGYETVRRAMESGEVALSSELTLLDGGRGFVLAVPYSRDGRFGGEVVSSFRNEKFAESITLPGVLARYDQTALLEGSVIYASSESGSDVPADDLTLSETFELGGKLLLARVRPRADVLRQNLAAGQTVLWTLGSLLALGIGGIVGCGTYWASEIAGRLLSQGTALRETQERLDGAMHQLVQAGKLAALGDLLAGAAHEINNPLSTIVGYTELFLMQELPPDSERRLQTIRSEAERIGKIMDNLLTFARKHPPMKRQMEINKVVEKTLGLRAYHLKACQIDVVSHLAPEIPMTMVDPYQIQQVLLNLLSNAQQAIAEKGREGRISVTTLARDGRIEIRVSDDGPGVPPEIEDRIFEPFFTTKSQGRGAGLGLSVCYGIVEEHGGRIRVESTRGIGSTFVVELPIVAETAVVERPAPAPAQPRSSLRVLVIDDEPSVRNVLVELLTWLGYWIDVASDFPEALEKIAENGHDLIITDMKMPHGSGRDVYQAILDTRPHLANRIVFTTGDGANPEIRAFLEETGNEIVLKPFTIEDLKGAIERAAAS